MGGDGDLGVVFKVTSGGAFTVLHSFSGSDGQGPTASLVQGSDGNFYGTTPQGGASLRGTVYALTPAGVFTTIHSFAPGEGRMPDAGLVEGNDGNFYGVTTWGGTSDLGTFFRVTPTGTLTTLHSFSGSDGQQPGNAFVKGVDGNFYGTIGSGGATGHGLIMKFTPAGVPTVLHTFAGGSDGTYPLASLVLASDGNFYGTTNQGGLPVSAGTIFRISATGVFQTIHAFSGADGQFPYSELLEGSSGVLYGTTLFGGGGEGSIYKITFGGTLTTLHGFALDGSEGRNTYAGLVTGLDGNFYGTTPYGGSVDWGTIYRVTSTGTLSVLHDFVGGDGQYPQGGLVFGTDGNLYGLAKIGGAAGVGTFFKLTTSGGYSNQYSFSVLTDGIMPRSVLALGSDGNFYGTAIGGGASGLGTVFRITPGGSFALVYSFAGGAEGSWPLSGLVEENNNLVFFGTTQYGGASNVGTVFKLDASVSPAALTWTTPFSGSDGSFPSAPLLKGSDGYYYGTAYSGGTDNLGAVFKLDASTNPATFVWTRSFAPGGEGQYPVAGLVEGAPGEFYGTTFGGGNSGRGTFFKITSAGVLSTLYSFQFSGTEGYHPRAGLLKGVDGTFYGVTSDGPGPAGVGGVFSITPGGVVSTLHTFAGSDGSRPETSLAQGSDGALYGITPTGGQKGGGVVFKITPPGTATAIVSGGGTICGTLTTTIQAALTGTPPWDLTWSDGVTQFGVMSSPATRTISTTSTTYTTTYTLIAFKDSIGPGTTSGSATVTVVPVPGTPIITAPASVLAGTAGLVANVPYHSGSTYSWGISNGTINTGQGSSQITFTAGTAGNLILWVSEVISTGCYSATGNKIVTVTPPATSFYTVTPCRLIDTRLPPGPLAGPDLGAASGRNFVPAGTCAVPSTAKAIALNIAVITPAGSGSLAAWGGGTPRPPTSTLNFKAGITRSNNAIIGMPFGATSGFWIFNQSGGATALVVDVQGYFE